MTVGECTPDTRRAEPNRTPDRAVGTGFGDISAVGVNDKIRIVFASKYCVDSLKMKTGLETKRNERIKGTYAPDENYFSQKNKIQQIEMTKTNMKSLPATGLELFPLRNKQIHKRRSKKVR